MKHKKSEEKEILESAEEIPATNEKADNATSEVSELETLRAEMLRFKDLALRNQAEFDNYRKRMVREKEDAIRYANTNMLERLLPVLDSFDLGLLAARKVQGADAIVQGFEMVEKQLHDFLRDTGVEAMNACGSDFDPNFHDAVSQQHDETVPEGKVLHQIRKGFKLKDRLLRAASVIISKGPVSSS